MPRQADAAPAPDYAPSGRLVVFAKAPRPGLVKTRMCPPLSHEQAADLYAHMLDDVVEASAAFGAALGLEVLVALYPAEACAELVLRVPPNVSVVAQHGADLAERMACAIMQAAATGCERILLRGSDSPVLGQGTVEAALRALDEVDVVLSPDQAGGYGLIGIRTPAGALFEHPMSTHTVYDETIASAERVGLRHRVLDAGFDLDTAGDFAHLEAARAAGNTSLCPRTLAYLDTHALWDVLQGDPHS